MVSDFLLGAAKYETSANPAFTTGSAAKSNTTQSAKPNGTGDFSPTQIEILSAVASKAQSSK
jgi:hypothetical protein